jgi:hypothetical protein
MFAQGGDNKSNARTNRGTTIDTTKVYFDQTEVK